MQGASAKLGTPLVVELLHPCFAPIKLVYYQVAPCCLVQGADLGQCIGGIDKYISDLFSLTLLQDTSSSSRLGDYVGTRYLVTSVLLFV